MKVLIIGSRVPWPLRDGGAIATYNLLKGLSESGVEVHFLTLNTKKHFVQEETIRLNFSFLKSIQTRFIDTGIRPYKAFINLFTNQSYHIDRFTSEAFQQDIQSICTRNSFDLIHFEGLFISQYSKSLNLSIPKILRQHNIEFNIWKTLAQSSILGFKKWYLALLSRRLENFEKDIYRCFDAIVSITEQDRKETEQTLYKGITVYIPAGIENLPSDNVPINYHKVYHIGSMEWMPNCEAMEWFHYKIWPKIEQKNKDSVFYMAGKHMPEHYKSWQSTSFKVIGEVEDQNEFIADKSILVVPLKSGSGIRIKTIEAMLAGKAVVSTSQGAMGLPILNSVHCIIADDTDAFAEAVTLLLQDVFLRNKIAEAGKSFAVEHFGNAAVCQQWIDFYQKIVSEF